MSFAHAALSGDYRPGAAHAFTLDTRVRDLVYGDFGFPEIQLSARGDEQRQSLTLVTAGEYQGEFTVAGTLQGEQWQGAPEPAFAST